DTAPFDRLIPYDSLDGEEVLEVGTGAGFHAELLARAGARVHGIDLTGAAVASTQDRFRLKNLDGHFEQWDAEIDRADFTRRFAFAWSWGVIHHSSLTARIVRNVANWIQDDGSFAGMVYHRDSTALLIALVRQWILRGKLFSYSVDEALWRNTDGFSARYYPAEQWRDLLLAFFERADVFVAGIDTDLPVPRSLRRHILPHVPPEARSRYLSRYGSFVVFSASHPLRS
ncbi:MAG TPA: class I SAM-dependent methyltransferase, partial [Acidimicrobiales bacterium]